MLPHRVTSNIKGNSTWKGHSTLVGTVHMNFLSSVEDKIHVHLGIICVLQMSVDSL